MLAWVGDEIAGLVHGQGIPPGEIASSSSPDVVRARSTELLLNFLGIRMDSYGGVRVHR